MNYENILLSIEDGIAHLRLNRPAKRNAVNNGLLQDIEAALDGMGADATVVVISGEGAHFSAGLDLSEHQVRTPFEVLQHSQWWHRVFHKVQFGGRPVVAALHGAVVGGGLELATSTHVRVAGRSTFYQLPEGQRGIFVGGGASVRVSKIIGPDRMTEMMLTGRRYDAESEVARTNADGGPEAARAKALERADAGQKLLQMLPRKRVGQPQDLDALLVMLCSDQSHFINGAVISADDGFGV